MGPKMTRCKEQINMEPKNIGGEGEDADLNIIEAGRELAGLGGVRGPFPGRYPLPSPCRCYAVSH